MDIYLVRHAIAESRADDRWPDDRDRPLSPKGEQQFRRAARGLGKVVPPVERVFSSPLERAWRTAEILAAEIKWPEPAAWPQLEPGRSPQQVILALAPHAAVASVALVGHEPGLSELCSFLLAGPRAHIEVEMKKGGVARLEVDGTPQAGTAILKWHLPPKVLRSI